MSNKSPSQKGSDDSIKRVSSEEALSTHLDVPHDTRAQRQASPSKLSASLILKVRTQKSRLACISRMRQELPDDVSAITAEELNSLTQQIEETHKSFLKEHAFLEVSWPTNCLEHEYFANDIHTEENLSYMATRRKIAKLRAALSAQAQPASSQPDTQCSSARLPDISLPTFKGEYTAWPEFRDLFKGMILENERLNNMERLHYLRTSLQGPPAQLISGLPITGDSLAPSWELLTERYENRRLFIETYLDQLFAHVAPVQRKSTALGQLMCSVKEALKALQSLGVSENLWEYAVVHHVARQFDKVTREQWETSMGSHMEYPRFDQLEEFLSNKVRALERVEKITQAAPQSHSKTATAHPRPALSATTTSTSSSTGFSKSALEKSLNEYPCDCCNSAHFIVQCSRFRDMANSQRLQLVWHRRLCYNCLGRHNVRSCRSSLGCKKCSGRHHTMLHEAHLEYLATHKPANSSASQSDHASTSSAH